MERHKAQNIARRRIRHVDALLRRDPLRRDGISDGTEKTLLNELLQPLLGHGRAALGLHGQCSIGHEIGGDGTMAARVVSFLFLLSPYSGFPCSRPWHRDKEGKGKWQGKETQHRGVLVKQEREGKHANLRRQLNPVRLMLRLRELP
jgi:hypothetical protein